MTRTPKIRPERSSDVEAIRELTVRAFSQSALGHNGEADLIHRLRGACPDLISLVADLDGVVVGHILFSPVVVKSADRTVAGMGLAPMAVLPSHQNCGIGSALVRAGLDAVREAGHPFAVVLGHPGYYQRFGFLRASDYGISCTFSVPDEFFMVLPFMDLSIQGEAEYHPEFDAV